jgi:hypothetical protein
MFRLIISLKSIDRIGVTAVSAPKAILLAYALVLP